MEETSNARKSIRLPRNNKIAFEFPLSVEAADIPAIGVCGALSRGRQMSRCYKTSSAKFTESTFSPLESTETLSGRWVDMWPQFRCGFAIVSLASERHLSMGPPDVTAVQAKKV